MGRVVAVLGQKGGTGKTSTVCGLGAAVADSLIVDLDPQGSAWKWCTAPGCTIPVTGPKLAHPLAEVVAEARATGSWVWIDTPPYHPEISRQALGVADEALIPLCPSGVELAQLRDTLALVAGARPDIAVSIVLVKVKPHTRMAAGVRQALAEQDIPVLESEIGEREAIRAGFGTDLAAFYTELAKELAS
jgi:chromosome partitioning protein